MDAQTQGRDYEKFIQEVYNSILSHEGLNNIDVENNVKISGRSGQKHQIDIYWEFEQAGIKHKVAIECKCYNKANISISKIRDFHSVLNDIGISAGIFVCRNTFQEGAIKYADHYGINLIEVREPIEEDWKGRIKSISLNISICKLTIIQREIMFDKDWLENRKFDTSNLELDINYPINEDSVYIYNHSGKIVTSLHEIAKSLPHNFKSENKVHTFEWPEAYMRCKNLGLVKIKGVKISYQVSVSEPIESLIDAQETVKAIVKNVRSGKVKFLHNDGKINGDV